MNILIPMAGSGTRFSNAGYKEPKPLIKVFGKPMVAAVIDNLYHKDANFIFILNKEQEEHPKIIEIIDLLLPNRNKILFAEKLTDGPACTALLAEKYITDNNLIIVNCDQIIKDFDYIKLIEFANINDADGVIGSFISTSKKNSYIKLDPNGEVTEVKEKIVISNIATNGLHFWKKGTDFIESALNMISVGEKYNNEFYIAPTYNYMITQGKKILPYFYNLHFPIGTPEDLNLFHRKYK